MCLAKHVPVAQLLAFVFSLQAESYFLDGVDTGYFRELLDRMISERAALNVRLIVVSNSSLTADSWVRTTCLPNWLRLLGIISVRLISACVG